MDREAVTRAREQRKKERQRVKGAGRDKRTYRNAVVEPIWQDTSAACSMIAAIYGRKLPLACWNGGLEGGAL